MPSSIGHTISATLKIGLLSVLLSGCGSTLDNLGGATGTTEGEVTSAGNVTINWGSNDSVRTGYGTTTLTMSAQSDSADANEIYFPNCFDNNRSCRRANSTLRSSIYNNPVAVQSFQLNFSYANPNGSAWSQVVVDAASVTTAELRFNGSTGVLAMGTSYTKQLVSGATCDLSSIYSVGYASVAGTPKILTGFQFFEEGILSGGTTYSTSHLTAGRVWHSGLYPADGSTALPLAFQFLPADDAVSVDFGIQNFTESSTGIAVSPKFGLTSSDSVSGGYKNHVIIGFCLQGRKIGAATRPLILFSEAFVRQPKLQNVQ